jgi:hypothetical protein
LTVAARLQLHASTAKAISEALTSAKETGRGELRVGSNVFEVRHSRRQNFCAFRNRDVRGTFDYEARGKWKLELIVQAEYLATHPLETVLELVKSIASDFGVVGELRLRRFDLCADFVDFEFFHDDGAVRILTQRARAGIFRTEPKDVDDWVDDETSVRDFLSGARITSGYSIAPGNNLSARIYDKTAELEQPGRSAKQAIEHARWRERGWREGQRVVRVEFQHRGRWLDRVRLRDIDSLPQRLDDIWQYDVQWLRMVDPTSATRRTRCVNDARWQVVATVVFSRNAEPAKPIDVPGEGADPALVRGATLSMLAARGRLPEPGTTEDGEVLSEGDFVDSITAAEQEDWVRRHYRTLAVEAAEVIAIAELGRGARVAVIRALTHSRAAIARFARVASPASEDRDHSVEAANPNAPPGRTR